MEANLNELNTTKEMVKDNAELNRAETLNRWRLILGESAEEGLSNAEDYSPDDFKYTEVDEILGYLYNREYGEEQGYRKGEEGALRIYPFPNGCIRSGNYSRNQR